VEVVAGLAIALSRTSQELLALVVVVVCFDRRMWDLHRPQKSRSERVGLVVEALIQTLAHQETGDKLPPLEV
jgi:hypothetical protein